MLPYVLVIKTTVYLPERTKRRLAKLAQASGRSQAELIREGVDRLVGDQPAPRPTLPLFSSGHPDTWRDLDKLMEGFGER